MAKKVYIGVGGKARKVKKIYIGVGGKARKVKKGYIGVGGKARPFFTSGEVVYYGNVSCNFVTFTAEEGSSSNKNKVVYSMTGVTHGSRGTFAGGPFLDYESDQQYAGNFWSYDSSLVLTRSKYRVWGEGFGSIRGASVGTSACFAGGYSDPSGYYGMANALFLDASTTTSKVALGTKRRDACVGSTGNYALVAGGRKDDSETLYNTIEAFNSSYTRTALSGTLAEKKRNFVSGSIGSVAVFAGGRNSKEYTNTVDSVNSSLTVTPVTALDSAFVSALNKPKSVGNYLLFYNTKADTVKAYNSSFTWVVAPSLATPRANVMGVSIGGFVMMAGGNDHATSTMTELYDESLTLTAGPSFTQGRYGCSTVVAGNYAIFAGGRLASTTNTSFTSNHTTNAAVAFRAD